jgi:hypothetical protein
MHGRFVIAAVVVSGGLTAAAAAAAAPGIGIVVVMYVGHVHWFWQLGAPVTVAAGAPATASRRRESSGLHYSTNIDWCVEEDGRVCGLRVLLVVALRHVADREGHAVDFDLVSTWQSCAVDQDDV